MLGDGGQLMQLFSGNDDGCRRGGLRGCMLWWLGERERHVGRWGVWARGWCGVD